MIQKSLIQPVQQRNQEHPLSWFQERLWVLNQKNPRDLSYNIPVTFQLEGKLDVSALNRSLSAILLRHETLRARFTQSTRGEPVQVIAPAEHFYLPVINTKEQDVDRHVRETAEHVFDLCNGPIIIGKLLRIEPERHLLLLNVHHIAADGWSIEGILFAELQQCYAAFSSGVEPVLPQLPVQYTDFASWQRRQDLAGELAYWHSSLANYEDSLELPTDYLRRPGSGRSSDTFVRRYSKAFSCELDRFAQAHGCTLFMCLLAGFALTANRYSGKEDMCIGTTTSGRILPEIEGLIGFFINILPLRIQVDDNATVGEYLGAVRKVALSGFDHQIVPFERILYSMDFARSDKANPLVPLVLRHQNFPHTSLAGDLPGGLKFAPYSAGDEARLATNTVARCELELSYTGDREDLGVEVMYASDLHRRESIERLLSQHEQILKSMFADSNRRLSDLELLTEADVQRLCVVYNQTQNHSSPSLTFIQRWEAQVQATPNATACVDQHGQWSYASISSKVNALTQQLLLRGIEPGNVVGVCLDRSAALLVALLSVWKAGAAYVPLDPSYPEAYLQQIRLDSTAALTIVLSGNQSQLGLSDAQCVAVDTQLRVLTDHAGPAPLDRSSPEGLAYVMYTSGSTGKPKGVRVPHRQLINWMGGLERTLPFEAGEVVAQKTTFAFAVSVKELFAGLLNGCALVFIDTATTKDIVAFVAALSEHRVTRLNLVPSHLDAVLSHLREERRSLPDLKVCVTAGEPLTAELVASFREILPQARLLNNYGCTELNDITYYDAADFDGSQGFVPIGKPIQNTQLYVLDRRGRLVPDGAAGELHVASEGMSYGYQNLDLLTRERYLKNPFSDDPSSLIYNTGDVVKYLSDGNLEYIGRWDFQVKVRGFRVDVRHVEKILGEYPGIGARAVMGDGAQLFAYYVAEPGQSLDIGKLREFLQMHLPHYMVPSAFVAMEAMPRLPNGKLDRRALKPSAGQLQRSDVYEAPKTETEATLAALWSEVLEVAEDEIGSFTHFFEIGGHSLSATRLVARIKERLGVEIGLSQIFEHPRLDDLSKHVFDAKQGVWVDTDIGPPATQYIEALGGVRRVGGLLENKVILVTGSSRGIGSATVRLLASHGASVAINYMQHQAHAQRAKELIEREGGTAEAFQADMTDVEQVNRMVREVRARFGKIDVLVANAAIGFKIQPFVEYDWGDFQRKITDELKSIFCLCQAVLPEMLQRKSGSIVAVSSSMSKLAERGYIAHSAAKAALDAFVRSLAIEVGPDGVRVNTVAPGLTLTDATANLSRQHKDAAAARCPLRRNGLPRDVAGAVLFLASDLSEFMTGTYLPVDGGFTML